MVAQRQQPSLTPPPTDNACARCDAPTSPPAAARDDTFACYPHALIDLDRSELVNQPTNPPTNQLIRTPNSPTSRARTAARKDAPGQRFPPPRKLRQGPGGLPARCVRVATFVGYGGWGCYRQVFMYVVLWTRTRVWRCRYDGSTRLDSSSPLDSSRPRTNQSIHPNPQRSTLLPLTPTKPTQGPSPRPPGRAAARSLRCSTARSRT